MKLRLADRMQREDFQGDFVKMMLKAAASPQTISFAGGLPNPISFPIEQMRQAAEAVLTENGAYAMQYNTAAGYEPLRAYIAERYKKIGAAVSADDILITNGSQQAIDILSAVLLNEGDEILVENPSYLSALQTFHLYGAKIHTVQLRGDGADCAQMRELLSRCKIKFFYAVPNFQNPTGLSYSLDVRKAAADAIRQTDALFIEDNPYGELRFKGEQADSFHALLGEQCLMIGTFSKTISPGMRIGWICCAHAALREKMIAYKQLVDLHTNIFGQMTISKYLENNDLDAHIEKIKGLYQRQSETMIRYMEKYFPADVHYTEPEGGMFIWATLPKGLRSIDLFERALAAGVAIAPGDPFYESERNVGTFRLNYTNCDDQTIEKGIRLLARIIHEMKDEKGV